MFNTDLAEKIGGISDPADITAVALLSNKRLLLTFLYISKSGIGFYKNICKKPRNPLLIYVENGERHSLNYYTCNWALKKLKNTGVVDSVRIPGYNGRTGYVLTHFGRNVVERIKILTAKLALKQGVAEFYDGIVTAGADDIREMIRDTYMVDPELFIAGTGMEVDGGHCHSI